MTPDQFVKDAVRTESRIETVNINYEAFTALAKAIIALGNILDAMKKNTFYGKPFDNDKILEYANEARNNSQRIYATASYKAIGEPIDIRQARINTRIFHSVVGIVTEAVELLEAIDLDSDQVDEVNLREEFGDLAWYIAIGLDETNSSFEQVLDRVIAKLRARYPEKFTSENAINRDLVKERKVLEGKE
jgi:NTP pyrophosphatase (non-canonical NTP hydrolase)